MTRAGLGIHPKRRAWAIVSVSVVLMLNAAATSCSSSGGSASQRGGTASSPSTTTRSSAVPLVPAPRTRTVDGDFFGFNGGSIIRNENIDLLMNPKLQDRLGSLDASLIRIPTGTAAQWINWRTGRFIDDPTSPFATIGPDRHPVTMTDWARLLDRTGLSPVWDLNVLTSTLDDQIAMLERARQLGMPVQTIELGNELWDARSIYPKVYPSGTAYAQAMNAWIPELRKRFPEAKIAVSGADESDEFFSTVFGKRYQTWNEEVIAHIRGADAIAIHPYWTLPDRAAPGSDIAATLTAGTGAWDRFVQQTLSPIPATMGVWLTEWNQAAWGTKSGTQIWAQALSVVAVAMRQVSNPRIEMSLVHDIVDGVTNPQDVGTSITFPLFTDGAKGSEPMQPTALGFALPLLFSAIQPGVHVQTLHVNAPASTADADKIEGVLIGGARPGAVLVNLGSRAVVANLTAKLGGSWQATTLQAEPNSQPGWVRADQVTRTQSTVTSTLTIPAYSVIRLTRS